MLKQIIIEYTSTRAVTTDSSNLSKTNSKSDQTYFITNLSVLPLLVI